LKKAIDIAKVSAKGSIALSIGMMISNGIMALGTFLIASFLPAQEYGLYAVTLVIPSLLGLFQDLGINSAIIKYTAQYRAENKQSEIKRIIKFGILFDTLLGASLAIIAYLLSGIIAINIFQRPRIKQLIEITSIYIFAMAIVKATQSVFIGFERMEFQSLLNVIQSTLKGLLSPLLVLLGYGLLGAIVGISISSGITAIIGLSILIILFYRKIESAIGDDPKSFPKYVGFMLSYGLPVSASMILTGFQTQFFNFLMAVYCEDLLIANYQMAVNFTVLIGLLSTPIMTALFPAFSKLKFEMEKETLKSVFKFSVKYSSLIVIPVTAAIMALSKPLVYTLFGEKFSYAPFYLTLLAINSLYVGIGSLSVPNLIMGQGRTDITLKMTLLNLSVGIPLSLILIPSFGVIGLITTTLIATIPGLVAGLWWARRRFSISIDGRSGAKIYIASGIAGVIAYLITYPLTFPYWVILIFGGIVFLLVYFVLIIILKAIDMNDLENIKAMLRDLGPLYTLLKVPFGLVERLLAF